MGLFDALFGGNSDDVPNTISDDEMNDIRVRAQKAHGHESWVSDEAVAKRKASNKQHDNRWWS
ncbi:MAG TPA: hypothetical protein VF223_23780 [Trebonia sp.]